MSAPQPLQERVLSVLVEQGPVRAKDLGHWLRGIDGIALDCAMNSLMKANKVSLALGMYELVKPVTPQEPKRAAVMLAAPPTAAEETAASLPPAEVSAASEPKRIAAVLPEELARVKALLTSTEGYCLACNQTKPANAFQCSKLGKLHKRCIACAQEAVSVGVKAAKARRTQGAVAAPVAPSHTELIGLAHKRVWLVQKREQLRLEYEVSVKALDERIEEIDRVTEQVRKLLEVT